MVQSVVVNQFQATGLPGEFSRSDNADSDGMILNSVTETRNQYGRVVRFNNDSTGQSVGVNESGNIAGILACPKTGVRTTLEHQTYIPNGSQVEIATRGYIFVSVPAAANVGDYVFWLGTGEIVTAAPNEEKPENSIRLPGGLVKGFPPTGAGVAEIYFDLSGSRESFTPETEE